MQRATPLETFWKDKWFSAFILGEATLVLLGFVLPLIQPLARRPVPLFPLIALTAFRLFFLWGISTKQRGFQVPYFLGVAIFFFITLGVGRELALMLAGYFPYKMNWGRGLLVLAWTVRLVGVSWYIKRGRQMEIQSGSSLPAAFATAMLVMFCLSLVTPFGLYLAILDRVIYGIHFESL